MSIDLIRGNGLVHHGGEVSTRDDYPRFFKKQSYPAKYEP